MATCPVTSGLQVVLDARTITGKSDGDALTTAMVDQTGNGFNADVYTGFSYPTYKATSINGKPAIRFNSGATDQVLQCYPTSWGTTGFSAFMLIGNGASGVSGGRLLSCGPTSSADTANPGGLYLAEFSTLLLMSFGTNNSTVVQSNNLPIPNGVTVLGVHHSATERAVSFNGTKLVVDSGSFSWGATGRIVFAQRYNSNPVTGTSAKYDLAMFAAFNRGTTDSETMQVASWMLREYGYSVGEMAEVIQ